MNKRTLATVCSLFLTASALAANRDTPSRRNGDVPLMDHDREVRLALSAAPPRLRDGAGVWVLEEKGYVATRPSRNGIGCLVEHSIPESIEPICWDSEGVETLMPATLERARLRGDGKTEQEIDETIAQGWASGRFRAPRRNGIAYMLSGDNQVPAGKSGGVLHYPPHVMFYAPYLKNADIGGGTDSVLPWIVSEGKPYAYIIVVARDGDWGKGFEPGAH